MKNSQCCTLTPFANQEVSSEDLPPAFLGACFKKHFRAQEALILQKNLREASYTALDSSSTQQPQIAIKSALLLMRMSEVVTSLCEAHPGAEVTTIPDEAIGEAINDKWFSIYVPEILQQCDAAIAHYVHLTTVIDYEESLILDCLKFWSIIRSLFYDCLSEHCVKPIML